MHWRSALLSVFLCFQTGSAGEDTIGDTIFTMLNKSSIRSSETTNTDLEASNTVLVCRTVALKRLSALIKRRRAQIGKKCVFPFTLRTNNKTYHSCTWDFSYITGYEPWCSTAVDSDGYHITKNPDGSKNWGICNAESDDQNIYNSSCPIEPRYCGTPTRITKGLEDGKHDPNINIKQQPWMVSIGKWEFDPPTEWMHHCSGTIITSNHVLTSASCFTKVMSVDFTSNLEKQLQRYTMKMGTADLRSVNSLGGTERTIKDILLHPKYNPKSVHYDVGIAVSAQPIIFTDFVRSVCLPYLPIDNPDHYHDKFMTLVGWSNDGESAPDKIPRTHDLTMKRLKIRTTEQCDKSFSVDAFNQASVNVSNRNLFLPYGFSNVERNDLACVALNNDAHDMERCSDEVGSPLVERRSGTARGDVYYEQQFIVSEQIDCRMRSKVITRISQRNILNWIQEVTDTTPMVMVVGGYDDLRPVLDPTTNKCIKDEKGQCKVKPGLTNDVEILCLSCTKVKSLKYNLCSKVVSKVFGRSFILGENDEGIIYENEAELLGLTGQFTKDTAIVCGGTNGDGVQDKCYEWDQQNNQWKSKHYHPDDGINRMSIKRTYASSVINQEGNMWVIGGDGETNDQALRSTEIYEYKPKGKGRWKTGPNIPNDLVGGLESHCTVRLNNSHTMLIGGFESAVLEENPNNKKDGINATNFIGGGIQNRRTWMYNTTNWREIAESSIARDRPACSLVNMPNGKVNVLVAGGCDGWCVEKPGLTDAEMYDPEKDTWSPVASLPIEINSAKMVLLGGRPTIIGGYSTSTKKRNGKLYQYFVETNEWKIHPTEELRIPRSSAAAFQVPRSHFRC